MARIKDSNDQGAFITKLHPQLELSDDVFFKEKFEQRHTLF